MAMDTDTFTMLNAVTTATTSSTQSGARYEELTFFVNVESAGTVKIDIDASPDGQTWYELDTKSYTANGKDVFSYSAAFPFVRVDAPTVTSGTATVTLFARRLE